MLFLNTALLFGLFGISIPILIHLFNRRTAKTVDWGAMLFLIQSMVTRRRRILVEEVLLLVTRCLLLGLLALAMARPFVQEGSPAPWMVILPLALLGIALLGASFALWRYPGWRLGCAIAGAALIMAAGAFVALERRLNLSRFGGGERKEIALVIDGSTSMTMASGGRSNFESAVAEAESIIRAGSRKSAFSLIIAGSAAEALVPAPISDRRELLSALDDAKPGFGTMHVPDAMLAAAIALAQGYNPAKLIILITDGQRTGWDADNPARWELLKRAFSNLPEPPRIVVRTLDMPSQYRNLALGNIAISRKVVGTDREVGINIHVENTGTEAVTPSAVELTVGEKRYENRGLSQMAPGAAETVTFLHRFDKPGTGILSARVLVEDDLPGDDSAVRAVSVVNGLRVLVVDGNPTGRFMESAGAFSALALAPSPETASGGAGATKTPGGKDLLVTPEIVRATDLHEVQNLAGYHVIILADVPRLPGTVATRLARYVADGGGLLAAPGGNADIDFYDNWSLDGYGALMPARLLDWTVAPDSDEQIRLAPTTFSHASLRTASSDRDDISACRISACRKLSPHDLPGVVETGARLSNGDPFLVQRSFGEGLVLLTAVPLDTRVSNLATLQSFVPFIHEAVYHLANPATPHLNMDAGRDIALRLPIVADASQGKADAPPQGTVLECTAIDPGRAARRAALEMGRDAFTARIEGAVVPGLYRLFVPQAQVNQLSWLALDDGSIPVTVGREIGESEMKPLSETEFAMIARHGEFARAGSMTDVESALAGKAFGDELWRPLASAALALVVFEVLLCRWITLKRRTGREEAVGFEAQAAPSAKFREQLATLRTGRGT